MIGDYRGAAGAVAGALILLELLGRQALPQASAIAGAASFLGSMLNQGVTVALPAPLSAIGAPAQITGTVGQAATLAMQGVAGIANLIGGLGIDRHQLAGLGSIAGRRASLG